MTNDTHVIDLSTHNGVLTVADFKQLKEEGIRGGILRIGYGGEPNQKDACFEQNYAAAKAAQMPVGIYHYSYAKTVSRVKEELSCVLQWAKGKQFELPVYFDIEDRSQESLGKKLLTDIIVSFCEGLSAAGYYPGVYANKYWLTSLLDYERIKKWTIWVAQYAPECTFAKPYDLWQYTSNGRVSGIDGRVDLNWCYKDFTKEIKEKGLNGFRSALVKPNEPQVTKTAIPLPEKNKDGAYQYHVKKYGSNYPIAQNFKLSEYQSQDGADLVLVYPETIFLAQRIRNRLGEYVISNSSYRSPAHNKAVGGVSNSQHIFGRAMDLVIPDRTPSFVAKQAEVLGARCTIIYVGFCHVDMRSGSKYFGYNNGGGVKTNLVTLRSGNEGQHVRDLQVALKDAGEQLGIDGIFGENTTKAIKAFQKANKLQVDGICGNNTWNALLKIQLSKGSLYTLTSTLNVRQGAGVEYNAIAELPVDSPVIVFSTKNDREGAPWGNIGIGWISLNYAKKQ